MSDMIERLYYVAAESRNHDGETDALVDAADEIERLNREVDIQKSLWAEAESELEAADKKIAELEAELDEWKDACDPGVDRPTKLQEKDDE